MHASSSSSRPMPFSQSDLDKAVETLAIAESGLARAEASILEGKKDIISAEKTLAYQRARLADTEITVPLDGLIVERYRDPGDVVVPGSPFSRWFRWRNCGSVPGSTRPKWTHRSWAIRRELSFVPNRNGPILERWLAWGKKPTARLGSSSSTSRVLQLPKHWAIGQRAEVYIETDRKQDVVLLPASFVRWQEDAPGVFVNLNGKAAWRSTRLASEARRWLKSWTACRRAIWSSCPKTQR